MIYNLDYIEEIRKIEISLNQFIKIKNSFSENPKKYRMFFNEIENIEFSDFKNILMKSEYSLLIEFYSFSEQLLKNLIYHCLEYSRHENQYINQYLSKKLNPEKFSPSPKFSDFEKELKMLTGNFKFLVNCKSDYVIKYDEMIKSRHKYAHANNYSQDILAYEDNLHFLKYLIWESENFINDYSNLLVLKNEFKSIINIIRSIKKKNLSGNANLVLKKQNIDLKLLKTRSLKLLNNKAIPNELDIFKSFIMFLTFLSNTDLRKLEINLLKNEINKIDDIFT